MSEQKTAEEKLPISICPVCGYEPDAMVWSTRPEPGDLSVCLKCGEVFTFDEQLRLVTPTVAYLMALGEEVHRQLGKVQRLIRRTRPVG